MSKDFLIDARPTKRFFVEMFTRDIELEDAILDLLDNCVDGVLRSLSEGSEMNSELKELPYEGFFANITFNESSFKISDNCGGIPIEIGKSQVFRLGRTYAAGNENLSTVGMYGIGMKRSIFKMGQACKIESFRSDGSFQVQITRDWMESDDLWDLEMEPTEFAGKVGTHIEITDLHPHISQLFRPNETIHADLPQRIGHHFGYIIQKGFEIRINDRIVASQTFGLLVSENGTLEPKGIAPYIYQATINDEITGENVEVKLAIGFYRPMIDSDELEEEALTRRSSDTAGWTIVCNDRVVLYNDKTRMTGWGESQVPSYHTQFIGIMGVVFFNSKSPSSLPLTTTKRGIDASSNIYLYVKNYMRTGLKKFTDYTNRWKSNPIEEKKIASKAKPLSIQAVFNMASTQEGWRNVKNKNSTEKILDLELAKIVHGDPLKQIKFHKRQSEIDKVAVLLYGSDTQVRPAEVGEACFDQILTKSVL